MSVEQAKAFIERMKTDDAFREKVRAIKDAAGRIACIRGAGFECTEEEINEVEEDGSGEVVAGTNLSLVAITALYDQQKRDRESQVMTTMEVRIMYN